MRVENRVIIFEPDDVFDWLSDSDFKTLSSKGYSLGKEASDYVSFINDSMEEIVFCGPYDYYFDNEDDGEELYHIFDKASAVIQKELGLKNGGKYEDAYFDFSIEPEDSEFLEGLGEVVGEMKLDLERILSDLQNKI